MFDIGFLELAIIAVVGLIVIGPERLPEVARTVGTWVGKFRRFVSSVKSDIERELRQDEIRKARTGCRSRRTQANHEYRDLHS